MVIVLLSIVPMVIEVLRSVRRTNRQVSKAFSSPSLVNQSEAVPANPYRSCAFEFVVVAIVRLTVVQMGAEVIHQQVR